MPTLRAKMNPIMPRVQRALAGRWIGKRTLLAVVPLLAIAPRGLAAQQGTAGGQPPAPRLWIRPPGPIVIRPESTHTRVYLRSVADTSLKLTLAFYPSEPVQDTTSVVVVKPDAMELKAAATAVVTLDLRRDKLTRIPYTGYLAIVGAGRVPDTLAVRIDTVGAPKGAPAVIAPRLLPAWAIVTIRGALGYPDCDEGSTGWTCVRSTVLPIPPGAQVAAAGTVLGYVSDTTNGVAAVKSLGRAPTTAGGAGVRLSLGELRGVGRYRGDVVLTPGDTAKVRLNVLVTHSFWGAALAIAVGVTIAWLLHAWLTSGRQQGLLGARILQLGDDYRRADAAFQAALAGTPTGYSVGQAVANAQTDCRHRLEDATVAPDPSAALTALQTLIDTDRAQLALWPRLGGAVAALARSLAALSPTGADRPPGISATIPPAFVAPAQDTVRGRALTDLSMITPALDAVQLDAARANGWQRLNESASPLYALSEQLLNAAPPEQARKEIKDTHEDVLSAWEDLWKQVFDPAKMESRLRQDESTLGKYADFLPQAATVARTAMKVAGKEALARRGRSGKPEPDILGGAPLMFRRIRRTENFFTVVVVTAAVLLGLNELYFTGAPFGTLKDYIGAFLWGFGAKAGLEAVKALGGGLLDRWPLAGRVP